MHVKTFLVLDENSVGRIKWSWYPFAYFKGYWNH